MTNEIIDYLIIKFSGLFDAGFYLKTYRDVRLADLDPLWHFIKHGWKEGRNPSTSFNTSSYLGSNPEVRNAQINPLIHYIKNRKNNQSSRQRPITSISNKPTNWPTRILPTGQVNKAIAYLRMYGFRKFINKVVSKLSGNDGYGLFRGNSSKSILVVPIISITSAVENKIELFDSKISVIIPTKDAGVDFEFLLKMYKTQKGIKEIEIVIVDSGSTDNTLEIAKANHAKIVTILPSEFSHSSARNLGAENATGDYFLFTVQDALPPTDTWLYELMTVLRNNNVSAVSCAEFPREDADLFYRVISWNHYRFLGVNEADRIYQLPNNPNYLTLRQNGQLSDLACLIPNDVFNKYKYRLNYAEDLDLGIRLIQDGEKIAFLGTIRIIHSHNRPAYYFLKRGYVDNLFLSDLFTDYPIPIVNYKDFVSDIVFCFNFLKDGIFSELSQKSYPLTNKEFESSIRDIFFTANNWSYPPMSIMKADPFFDHESNALLEKVINHFGYSETGKRYNGFLIHSLLGYSDIMFEYLGRTYERIDENLAEEIKACMYKELSQLTGAHLAYCYRNSTEVDKKNFEQIHLALKAGI